MQALKLNGTPYIIRIYCFGAGDNLGPYQILAPIGAGDMGEVYCAHDPS
jgi:hypothetical protein